MEVPNQNGGINESLSYSFHVLKIYYCSWQFKRRESRDSQILLTKDIFCLAELSLFNLKLHSIYFWYEPHVGYVLETFSPSWWLTFYSTNGVFLWTDVLNFNISRFTIVLLMLGGIFCQFEQYFHTLS